MELNIAEALRSMKKDSVFRLANGARPPGNYLFATLLPEVQRFDYQAKSGSMTVRTTMAGLVGMDSEFPEGGMVEISTFSEETAKVANRVTMTEKALRDLHEFLRETGETGGDTKQAIVETALNFTDKLIVQAHLDTFEWLRARAICTGEIDWTFNGKRLYVDYGIPAGNVRAQDTGTSGWGGSATKFWVAIKDLRAALKHNVRAMIANSTTIDEIRYNPANSMAAIAEDDGGITFRKLNDTTGKFTDDVSDTVRIVKYDLEVEVIDLDNPGRTTAIPVVPNGTLVAIGNANTNRFVVGSGSTAELDNALGYTHLAPTVEGDFRRGRWARVFTPENQPWSLRGEGVTNGLPVIEEPSLIARASTVFQ